MSLSNAEIRLIETSWETYNQGDIVNQGVHMFMRIFTKRPDMKPIWSISMKHDSEEQYKKSPKFRFHVKRLFSTIGMVVDGLEYLHEVEPMIEDLGRRHIKYGIKRAHFEVIADGLLYALENALGNKFTPEVKNAWCKLYGWLAEVMIRALPAEN
ncbi:neuroglobin-like [Liolophura sinensis]|uniref:neuroglobin-like n=1 Tax=Liolophura sinensis TaxID=3198878 RepID=UPI003158BF11